MWELQAQGLPYERSLTRQRRRSRKSTAHGRADEGPAHRQKRPTTFSPNTPSDRTSSTSAAARTCPTPRRSRRSSCFPSPAPTGKATRRTSSCSASTAPPCSRKKELDEYLQQARRGQETRPPQARPGTRSVQHPGTRRTRADLLPSQGRHRPQAARRLDARRYLKRGYSLVYTPHVMRRESVEDLRPRQFLSGEHVHAHGAGRRRISAQADELPRPHSDL